ncbi:MAG: carotenoid 1,2-hydratase [Deltaproteobacteria bacterium]
MSGPHDAPGDESPRLFGESPKQPDASPGPRDGSRGPRGESLDSAPHAGPRFDEPVPYGGYRWHYLDALTDDGSLGIVIIAMVGNPFSPAYARARSRGAVAEPWRYTSMNVAVYGRGRRESAWALAERPQRSGTARPGRLELGPSAMEWESGRLVVTLDERTTPLAGFRRPVRGRVVFHPDTVCAEPLFLDAAREHRWWPIAPRGWVEVDLAEPGLRFAAHGYLDANLGLSPLDRSFDHWCWSRGRVRDGAIITYDATLADGSRAHRALRVARDGACSPLEGLVRSSMGLTSWGIPRHVATDGARPSRLRSLEDGPFYAREVWQAELAGERTVVVHETLSGRRLRRSWVKLCTGYRMRVDG